MKDLVAESVVRVSPSVYARDFGEELVLLDFGRGEYFGLDAVGTDVFRAIEAGHALGDIARTLTSRYAVALDEALRDVIALVSDMRARGLVEDG